MNQTSDREYAFKRGFLEKLASLGMTPEVFFERIKKADVLDQFLAGGIDVGKSALSAGAEMGGTGLKYGLGAALAAPLVVGGAGGMAHALMDSPKEKDIDLIRKAEVEGLYARLTKEINERRRRKLLERGM